MTDQTRADFDEFVQPQTDTNGNYVGDHYALWQAATLAERARCEVILANNVSVVESLRQIRASI